MIVVYLEKGFEVVLQRHHARLAASLMEKLEWIKGDPYKIDLIMAAADHDDNYTEFRRKGILNEPGGPKDFTMETFDKANCQRLLDESLSQSIFIAILIACHIQFVKRNLSAAATRFCDALESKKQHWCNQIDLSINEMKTYYTILQWCDALSLLVCQRIIPPEGRSLEISAGPDGVPYFISARDKDCYTIDPWPFSEKDFTINVERRLLDKLKFRNDKELQDALFHSPITVQQITFSH
ncbi:hypothetical protein SMI01S_16070 [Sphingobacterium mizutaii NBRC 14946 = DSM 11724]|uniref:DUF3891 family protein n=2 Tax=Sphingobacterium mizutaii TaxID=1010 RepID=A0AAJ4X9C3_9SPHI|nr:DUF3891 family protein [Sphingobacterium mizutaii]GEM68001.1 hypothetical protein SMI01S_16070 [Sphingobacterium mizutaii NBRC 14946 = DSM 11724]SDL78780.1 Protein of unknown function [Sphingobacterium mizutaii]SNV37589.1 Uncharacterised protein [Sphingobacterium mizutaii]